MAGMLEMGSAFLPVNHNWQRYLQDSEDAYRELENELTQSLKREADLACHSMTDNEYKKDPWFWDLDWSVQPIKMKKAPKLSKKKKNAEVVQAEPEIRVVDRKQEEEDDDFIELRQLETQFQNLMATKSLLYKKGSFLPGYPGWYRALCDRNNLEGPMEISTSAQVVPQLLKLTWEGYPLHHSRELGWGYLVPGRPLELCQSNWELPPELAQFPLQRALQLFPPRVSGSQDYSKITKGIISSDEAMRLLDVMDSSTADPLGMAALWQVMSQFLKISIWI